MDFIQRFRKAYGEVDKNLMGGWLPGGAARTTNVTEAILNTAAQTPPAQMLRSGMNAAGRLLPQQFGPLSDAGENAIRAVTGDRRDRNPSEYTPATRTQLADAIDRAEEDQTMLKDDSGFTAVDYKHYNKDGSGHKGPIAYVGGRIWAKQNDDGSYSLRDDERYDFNAKGQGEEYKQNLDDATMAAIGRGDFKGFLANVPDHLAYHTGAGAMGFNIGGTFNRPGTASPQAELQAPQPVADTPSTYTVQSGDTLSSIANSKGVSIRDLMSSNDIEDANIISIGQQLKY